MKTCSHCKTEKPLTEFHKTKQAKDGLAFKCKVCISARMKIEYLSPANRERAKIWKKNNQDKTRQYSRIWASKNPEISSKWKGVHPEYQKACLKKDVDGLSNRYIKALLVRYAPSKSITNELIEAKRLHIQLVRKLKELKA